MKNRLTTYEQMIALPAVQAGFGTVCLLTGMLLTRPAAAAVQTLGEVTNSLYVTMLPLQYFLSSIVFLLGIWYVYKGVQMLRGSGEGGQGAPSVQQSLYKLGGGGALISLPFIVDAVLKTMVTPSSFGEPQNVRLSGDMTRAASGPGLDQGLIRFTNDFFMPFMNDALPYFCYITGLVFMIRGIQRVANGDGKGGTAPLLGTSGIFLTGAGLMSMGYLMNMLQGSIFGQDQLFANVLLVDQSALSEKAESVLWAVFQFLRIVGYIAVVRGLLMLKAYADGAQGASIMGGSTHIISGAMLANVWYFIWAVQRTFLGSDTSYDVFRAPQ